MRRLPQLLSTLLAAAALAAPSLALQGPDVVVSRIGYDGGNSNDFIYYGQSGGIAANLARLKKLKGGD